MKTISRSVPSPHRDTPVVAVKAWQAAILRPDANPQQKAGTSW
jgi:hypothetical protein